MIINFTLAKGQIMKKRLFLVYLSLFGLSLASMGLLTAKAYFTSQTQINNNSLSLGTLVMKLNGDQDSLSAVWTGSNLKPGDSVSGSFEFKNAGSIDAEAVGFTFVNQGFNQSVQPTLDNKLRLTGFKFGQVELISDIEAAIASGQDQASVGDLIVTTTKANGLAGLDIDSDGHLNLAELNSQELVVKRQTGASVAGLDASSQSDLAMTLLFVSGSNDNDYQGDSLTTDITGTLYQVAP